MFLTVVSAKNLPGFLELLILRRTKLDTGAKYAVTTIVGYLIIAFGTLAALNKAGLQWSELKFVAGAFSLGLAFGMQEIIANFVCGIILLFERPVRIGDYVTIGSQSGTVKRIQIRAVTLQDLDRRETVIPNKKLITDDVTNWSLTDEVVRMTVPVGIAYGSDTALAQQTMMKVLMDNPNILKTPAPTVLFLGFGDSSLDFEIRGFMNDIRDLPRIKSQIHLAVDDAFRKHNIEIPFPQRVVHHVPAPQTTS